MKPVKWRELVTRLRRLGAEGPFYRGKHPYMDFRGHVISVPNPHRGDISVGLLKEILRQAGISKKEWESTK